MAASAGEKKEIAMKILLAYDGTEPAQRALDTAASIAKVMGASLDVISVVPVHPGRSPIDPWDDRMVHATELQDARTRLAGLGVNCQVLEPAGDPAEEIERVAKVGGYDMVVVGSRRQGVLGRVLQGSVSEHVATHADATVVIAR
jgi:nucleotide-binding universal stress UspA family protein